MKSNFGLSGDELGTLLGELESQFTIDLFEELIDLETKFLESTFDASTFGLVVLKDLELNLFGSAAKPINGAAIIKKVPIKGLMILNNNRKKVVISIDEVTNFFIGESLTIEYAKNPKITNIKNPSIVDVLPVPLALAARGSNKTKNTEKFICLV